MGFETENPEENLPKEANPETEQSSSKQEVNILACRKGHWETLAEEVTLEGRSRRWDTNAGDIEQENEIVSIPAGAEINVLGENPVSPGEIVIKIVLEPNNPERKSTLYMYVPRAKILNTKIKTQSGH